MRPISSNKGSSFVGALLAATMVVTVAWSVGRGLAQNVKIRSTIAAGNLFQRIEKSVNLFVTEKMNQYYLEASLSEPACTQTASPFGNVFDNKATASGLKFQVATSYELSQLPQTLKSANPEVFASCDSQQTQMAPSFFKDETFHFCLIIKSENRTYLGSFDYSRKDLSTDLKVSCERTHSNVDRSQAELQYQLFWVEGTAPYSVSHSYKMRGYNADQGLAVTDQIGLFDSALGRFYLSSRKSEAADRTVIFSSVLPVTPTARPVAGDWDGNGNDGLGYYDQGTFYLKEEATNGAPERVFAWGTEADVPVTGKWENTRFDGIGLYNPMSQIFSYKSNTSDTTCSPNEVKIQNAPADGIPFGNRQWAPETGILGLYSPKTGEVCLVKDLKNPNCTYAFTLRSGKTYVPFVGDWYGDGQTRVGLFDTFLSRWQFWFDYQGDTTSRAFGPSPSSMKPVTGRWNAS